MYKTARRFSMTAVAVVSACLTTGILPAAADTSPEPVPDYARMGPPPPGANDWSCKPSPIHPRPVVLVHGTGSNMQVTYPAVSQMLREQGYCVFALNYGGIPTFYDANQIVWGVADIRRSSSELAGFVDAVLQHTGAQQADLVGHSQGGTMARQYLKFDGGTNPQDPSKNKIHSLVALGPTTHGTTFNGLQQLYSAFALLGLSSDRLSQFVFGIAGRQQLVGSTFIKNLNATGETMPGVEYTVIATKDDDVATPPENSFLSTANGHVKNIWVQDGCPNISVTHGGLIQNPRSLYLILSALDPSYANTHQSPCEN
jgi:triacylglycerol esterase/lipase EstA (alpha/beta hydrolase family)